MSSGVTAISWDGQELKEQVSGSAFRVQGDEVIVKRFGDMVILVPMRYSFEGLMPRLREICTFNGLAIAARAALAAGARSVLILDLDAHCGGGTASLIAGEPRVWQIDVSVSSYDRYPSSERTRLALVEKARTTCPRSGGSSMTPMGERPSSTFASTTQAWIHTSIARPAGCPGSPGTCSPIANAWFRVVPETRPAGRLRSGRRLCQRAPGRGWPCGPSPPDAVVRGENAIIS